ncbi:TPA: carbohydrate-binding protein [Candidatus Sumerlaeota bacterium]|jgi:arabinoxylan arabinofuranohydrolase|nr:carbohydrate-binding protein [Candidatus Sumerlaeota bacterium]
MKKRFITLLSAIMAFAGATCHADNPIVQTVYTADPAPMVYKDTLYVYTGHDEDNSKYFVMNDWRVFSTKDMVNWTHHGSPLSWKTFAWAQGDAWAGQCIERDGKFYYYVPVKKKGAGSVIGVAVGDTPTGPFKDAIGKPLVSSGPGDIDPTVFIDDDGQAYLYWGNPYLKYVKLNQDMISYDQTVGVVSIPLTEESFGKRIKKDAKEKRDTLYEEAPWLCKRNGLYYMVCAASGIPENIAYATSPNPTGPWSYRGIIMPTEGGSFTNHPGLIDFKGKSYFFYHNGALPKGGGFTRSVCVEEFAYNADGSFPTIKMSKEGPKAIANLDPYQKTEAETMAWEFGIHTTTNTLNVYVTDIDNGDYIKVKNVDFGKNGAASFSASVASAAQGGSIELHLDKVDGPQIGSVAVPNTGGWETWKSVTGKVSDATGIHDLYLVFKGNGTEHLFNFDYWKFEKK